MHSSTATVEVRKTVRGSVPRIPFEAIARSIFPKHYHLSLVICGDTLAERLNRTYRKKTYIPNVLSFPLTEDEGEIFLNLRVAEREARAYGVSLRTRLALLFVHGCLHLKGIRHGPAMEKRERTLLKRFT